MTEPLLITEADRDGWPETWAKFDAMRETAFRIKRDRDALFETLAGTDPETPEVIQPLSWLRSLIADARQRGPAADCDDPEAYWQMVQEVEELCRNGYAALALARGDG